MGGHTGTHIDALSHVSQDMRLHGGLDAAEASRGGRFSRLGVESIAPVVCRRVLLDVPRALGCEALEPAHAVTAADLELACDEEQVDVRAGDAVLVRSGWPVGRYHDGTALAGWDTGVPGPDESAARWLAARGVCVTGADTIAYEWLAPGAGHSVTFAGTRPEGLGVESLPRRSEPPYSGAAAWAATGPFGLRYEIVES